MSAPRRPLVQVPQSAAAGMAWPAFPIPIDCATLSLAQQMDRSQWWPARRLEAMQARQIRLLLTHAGQTVPFYRRRLAPIAGRLDGGFTLADLRRLPILERAEVQTAGGDLLSTKIPESHGSLIDVVTSGSTGQPVRLKANTVTGLYFRAVNLRYHLWHRRDFRLATARIARRNADEGEGGTWGICFGPAPFFLFDVTRPVDAQIDWLKTHPAPYLLTYPSNLQAMLERSRETGFRPHGLREVSTLGELVPEGLRDLCRQVWDVPMIDAYSAQEVGMIALQCPDHPHYHIQSEAMLVEVVDQDGAPCGVGETGRVVVTDLHNFATPLIRYAIGDHATVGAPCACGRGLPVIDRVLGRTRNMLTLPDGGRIWPVLNPVFEGLTLPIRQFQLVQRTPADIDVSLVVDRPLDAAEEQALKDALARSLNAAFVFHLTYVDEIPRAATGKFEQVRSLI